MAQFLLELCSGCPYRWVITDQRSKHSIYDSTVRKFGDDHSTKRNFSFLETQFLRFYSSPWKRKYIFNSRKLMSPLKRVVFALIAILMDVDVIHCTNEWIKILKHLEKPFKKHISRFFFISKLISIFCTAYAKLRLHDASVP